MTTVEELRTALSSIRASKPALNPDNPIIALVEEAEINVAMAINILEKEGDA